MLEQRDLQAIAQLIDVRVSKTEERLYEAIRITEEKVDNLEGRLDTLEGRFDTLEGRFDVLEVKVDALEVRITEVERNLTSELVRTEDILTRKLKKIESDVEVLKQDCRITKLENGNTGMVLKILEEYRRRLDALEEKTA